VTPDRVLAAELLAMAAEDARVRSQLASNGELFDGYHPRMAQVHCENARRLARVLATRGWPGRTLVGEEAAAAAWLVLQHAIGDPELQRRSVAVLWAAAAQGEALPAQAAMLEDRVRVLEGRPQRYGTQHDWDASGALAPSPIEDADGVDERRRAVGLEPLADTTRRLRAVAAEDGERPPVNPQARFRAMHEWACANGWRGVPR
jgi:hypothetical protein